jgi:site-specific DNA recombinase
MANNNNQSYKIALYIRVSTEEQAENPEGSIRNQEDRLRQAVEYKCNHGNFGKIHGVYVDAGISAKDMKRPKLQELLRAIRQKEIDLVMVTELSRLSRNTRDFIEMWDMMRAHGCRFTSLREDFDTTTAAGELVLFQLMNLAQFERKQTAERVELNIAVRAGRGLYNGGSVPVGYRTIKDKTGYLEVDEEMAEMVRSAFTAFLREGCLAHAALWLNNNGYQLRKQMEGGGRCARVGHFTVDNLQAILRNKAYIGIKSYSFRGEKKEAKAVWPAIIDVATFERVGKVLDKNRRRYKPDKSGKMPYIFSGLTCCATCSNPMSGKSAHGRSGKVGYYEHGWATKRDSTLSKKMFKCDPHRVPSRILEPAVWEKVLSFATDQEFARKIFEKVQKHHKENPQRQDMERLKAKLFGVNSQIDALSERIAELPKGVSADPLIRQLAKLQNVYREHEDALVELKMNGKTNFDRIVGLETFNEFAEHYRKMVLGDLSVTQKKQFVQKFIKKIEVGVKVYKVHYYVDNDHYRRELALREAGSLPFKAGLKLFNNFDSNTLTFGAPART